MEERVFGNRYKVAEKIGSGGMADVYKAVDQVLGRTVAVKVLHPRYAADDTFIARFRQEAQAAANLSNPHIVNIYDWGSEDSTYYIVMEYVRGTDLKSLVDQKGPVDPAKAAEYAAQVCSALASAHGYDIVHRDIKPHNIVLMPDGNIKVMDFGIARAGNTTMTQTGSVLGTAQYISPEQAQGRPIGPSSDLYSLGVVLYELTTGRLPFTGDTPVAVALKQVNEQPVPPRTLNPGIPPALEAVILHAMQKDPARRYTSADEMRDDLRRVVAGQPVAAAPAAMDQTSVLPAVGAGAPVAAPRRVERHREERPRNATWAWVLALITLVLIGGMLAWASGIFGAKPIPVPDVGDLPVAEATSTIERAGLTVGEIKQENSDTIREGFVISQSPPARTPLQKGQAVDLVVSLGQELLGVPDLTGMTQDEAVGALQDAGFKIGLPIRQEFSRAKTGTVTTQSPAPGAEAGRNTIVTFTVSKGLEQATVPSVAGKSEGAASDALKGAGFKVSVTRRTSDEVEKDVVIESDPAGGAQVAKGSTVKIIVSDGPELATVPDVETKSMPDAQRELSDAGFGVSIDSTDTPDPSMVGKIIDQTPSGGTKAVKGSTVTIVVGT